MDNQKIHGRMTLIAKEYEEACNRMIAAMAECRMVLDEYTEIVRWLRFDTVTGPIIGGCIIVGVVIIAAVGGYLSQ